MGGAYMWGWGPSDDAESIAAIRHAVEVGINWVDTAPVYGMGHSEEIVGKAVSPFLVGEDVFVFTKCGLDWSGFDEDGRYLRDLRPETIRFECEQSLKRLGIDRIDLYQIHWPETRTGTEIEDSWATMVELVDEGKVRWIGVSNFDTALLERCEALRHVDSYQPLLNLLHPEVMTGQVPWCTTHDVGVLAYSPLASGMLSDKYDKNTIDELAPDDWRRRSPDFNEPRLSSNLRVMDRLRPIAERLGVTLPVLAIAWILSLKGVTGAILGTRRPSHLDDLLPASTLRVTSDEVSAIEVVLRRDPL